METHIKITVIAIMLCFTGQLFAHHEKQIKNSDVEGLYLNLSDFKNGKLTQPTDFKHKGDKIKLKQFFISPEIVSIEQDQETVFYKDSIFAIRLTNGENYRFINRTPCFVADTSYLYIYTFKTTKTEYKQSGPTRRAKEIPVTYYFFSLRNQNDVFTLTLNNLRKYAFTDTIVHKTLCDKFTSDEMLSEINPNTGRFVLNETLLLSLKK